MCKFCAEQDRWPVDVTYRFYPKSRSDQPQDVEVHVIDEYQSQTLSFNVVSHSPVIVPLF